MPLFRGDLRTAGIEPNTRIVEPVIALRDMNIKIKRSLKTEGRGRKEEEGNGAGRQEEIQGAGSETNLVTANHIPDRRFVAEAVDVDRYNLLTFGRVVGRWACGSRKEGPARHRFWSCSGMRGGNR